MIYIPYEKIFGISQDPNVGLLFIITLLALLIFLELTSLNQNAKRQKVQYLRFRFEHLSLILFIIFLGMILNKITVLLNE